jgi:hypothetical protein
MCLNALFKKYINILKYKLISQSNNLSSEFELSCHLHCTIQVCFFICKGYIHLSHCKQASETLQPIKELQINILHEIYNNNLQIITLFL